VRPTNAKNNIATYARPLISSALIAGGLMQLVAPVLAQSLPEANSSISNTATASYEDPNTPNVPISTVSNTVTVKVAKIAGILVTEVGFTQPNTTDAFKPGQTVYSNFEVRNTGNDGVRFKVPKLADVSSNVTFTKVQYLDLDGEWKDADNTDSPIIAVGGILKVRIVSTINANAVAGDDIVSTLGNTSTPGLVNAQRGVGTETIDGKDIYTVDVADAGPSVKLGGVAANGIREASATQKVKVNAVKQAFAIVSLTNETPVPVTTNNGTPPVVTVTDKDNIKYNISVTVPTTDPNGTGKVATDLAPTAIQLATNKPAATVNRVIISNPLPTDATLTSFPTAPTGWTPVYATTSVGTPTVWSTVPPIDLATVKQVGFIYEPTPTLPDSDPAPTGTPLPAQVAPYTGFAVTLTTPRLGALTNAVSITGTTPGETDPTKLVVATATNLVTTVRAATISEIYNGPDSKPQATGPNNNNNLDFTNKSMQLLAGDAVRDANGKLIRTVTSSVVTFNNTIENNTNVAGDVYVLPTPPATLTDLPTGTIVKIKNINGSDTRSYEYNGTVFNPITGEENLKPLKLAIAGNGLVSYAVDVTLPVGQEQLKGYPVPVTAFAGPTAPTDATTIPVGAVKNTTIDRVYTGYIDLIKEARLLSVITDQDNTTIPYVKGDAALLLKAVPGKFIQYRIRAVNVSEDTSGGSVDSKVLSATKVKMLEDGLTLPNNWGTTTSHAPNSAKTRLGSLLLPSGTIQYNLGAKDNTDATVSRYDVNLGTNLIAPQKEGSFSFVRQVNDSGIVTPASAPAVTVDIF
jgi:hypothetical protein